MNRISLGRTIFFSSAYILLAIGFLIIHFTREKHFSALVGEIAVRGKSTAGTMSSPPKIKKLIVNVGGLELLFSKLNTAVLVTEDGIRHHLEISEWKRGDDFVNIILNDGASIKVNSNEHDGSLNLSTVIPATIPPVKSAEFPLQAASGADITIHQNNTLAVKTKNLEYMVTLPPNSLWNPRVRRLVVNAGINSALELPDLRQGAGISATEWLDQGEAPSETTFHTVINRWNADARGGWDTRMISESWDDELAAAILTDALQTKQLQSQVSRIRSIAENTPETVGWLPSPIMGDIVRGGQMHARTLRTTASNTLIELEDGQPSFSKDLSLSSLYDLGFTSEATRLLRLIRQIPPPRTSNREILSRLALLREAAELSLDDAKGDFELRRRLLEDFIIERVFWIDDGLWLFNQDGRVNMESSISAARFLLAESEISKDGTMRSMGQQMIISALAYADEAGALPAKLTFSKKVHIEGLIAPEKLYHLIINSHSFPRHVSLSKELGNGSWAITSTDNFEVKSSQDETIISCDFPIGAIHHMAIKGIDSFSLIYMRDIRWRSDPDFERYYAGWVYDEQQKILYIKLRHNVKRESIRIIHHIPEDSNFPTGEDIEASGRRLPGRARFLS